MNWGLRNQRGAADSRIWCAIHKDAYGRSEIDGRLST
jgi:hypothetical protein